MMAQFSTLITLLGVVIGLLGTLVSVVWRARGWIDRLNTTDGNLARAIEELTRTQKEMHQQNQERFRVIEQRLNGRAGDSPGRPGR